MNQNHLEGLLNPDVWAYPSFGFSKHEVRSKNLLSSKFPDYAHVADLANIAF